MEHIRTEDSGLARALANHTPQVAMTHLKLARLLTSADDKKE